MDPGRVIVSLVAFVSLHISISCACSVVSVFCISSQVDLVKYRDWVRY